MAEAQVEAALAEVKAALAMASVACEEAEAKVEAVRGEAELAREEAEVRAEGLLECCQHNFHASNAWRAEAVAVAAEADALRGELEAV